MHVAGQLTDQAHKNQTAPDGNIRSRCSHIGITSLEALTITQTMC